MSQVLIDHIHDFVHFLKSKSLSDLYLLHSQLSKRNKKTVRWHNPPRIVNSQVLLMSEVLSSIQQEIQVKSSTQKPLTTLDRKKLDQSVTTIRRKAQDTSPQPIIATLRTPAEKKAARKERRQARIKRQEKIRQEGLLPATGPSLKVWLKSL